jgi:arginine/lysine/ornithine decarboxylase
MWVACTVSHVFQFLFLSLQPEMTPREAFQFRNSPDLEALPLDEAADCVIAHGIIPYPPGIPLVMPGENIGAVVCRIGVSLSTSPFLFL